MKLLQLGKSGINEFVGFNQKASYRKVQWYFVTKIVLTYCEKEKKNKTQG